MRDLRKRRFRADTSDAQNETPVRVDGRAGHTIVNRDVNRDGLAGEHRLIDRRCTLDNDAVGRDLLARTNDDEISHLQRVNRHEHLRAVEQDARLFRAELEQDTDCRAGPPAGACFEVAAEQDQRRGNARDLEVRVTTEPAEQDDRRPQPGRDRPHGDKRVHRRREVPCVHQCRAMELLAGPKHNRRRQRERKPAPMRKVRRRHRAHHDERRRQKHCANQPSEENIRRRLFLQSSHPQQRRAVACLFDRTNQPLDIDGSRVERNRRALSGEVDGCLDTVELVQLPLDPRGTRGARHSLEREVDPLLLSVNERAHGDTS